MVNSQKLVSNHVFIVEMKNKSILKLLNIYNYYIFKYF